MNKKSEKTPQNNLTDSRKGRLSAALKSNMAKRKAQARERADARIHGTVKQEVAKKD